MPAKLKPVHPGEILREEFVEPLGLNPNNLALALRVPAPGVYDIVHERRGISPVMALRLARYFGATPAFWLNLQSRYDLEVAQDEEQSKIDREVQPLKSQTANR